MILFSYLRFIKSKQALADKKDEQSKNKAASIKLARTLFAIFIVFVACWTPYAILVLIDFNDRYVFSLCHIPVLNIKSQKIERDAIADARFLNY